MTLLDRLLDRLRGRKAVGPDAWDPAGKTGADLATLAVSLDAAPDDPRVAASRAAVLGAFAAANAGAPATPAQAVQGRVPARPRRMAFGPGSALAGVGLVAVLGLGTVAASSAGGPLYDLRVVSEGALLPSAPDPRAGAQVDRLDTRLDEADAAVRRGDAMAVTSALAAYARIIAEVGDGGSLGDAAREQLIRRVRAQVVAIDAMTAPDAATDAWRLQARAAAVALVDVLDAGRGPGGTDPEPGSSARPAQSGSSNGSASPSASAAPASSGSGASGSGGPAASTGPGGSSGPGGSPQSSRAPQGSGGPNASSAPGGSMVPVPSPSGSGGPMGSPGPAKTPSASANPSPSGSARPPGPGGGSGSPGTGSGG